MHDDTYEYITQKLTLDSELGFAPRSRSIFAMSTWSLLAAMCNGVYPFYKTGIRTVLISHTQYITYIQDFDSLLPGTKHNDINGNNSSLLAHKKYQNIMPQVVIKVHFPKKFNTVK